MRLARFPLLAVLILLGSTSLTQAQDTLRNPPLGGLVTLYQLDPELSAFDFTENHAGRMMHNHVDLNHNAEIDFGGYRVGSFSVAVSNASTGRIIDLGTAETLRQRYGYDETAGGGQGFASIHRKGTTLLILHRRGEDDDSKYQELYDGKQLLTKLQSLDSAPIALGHIYLIRVLRTGDWAADTFVKVLVVAYQADQSVTIRWETLEPE